MTRIKAKHGDHRLHYCLNREVNAGTFEWNCAGVRGKKDESCNRVAMQAGIPFFRDDSLQLKHFLQIHHEVVTYLCGSLEGFTLLCSSLKGRRQRSLCAEVSRLKRRLLEQATNLINDAVAVRKESVEKRSAHFWWMKLRHSDPHDVMAPSLIREIVDGEEHLFRQYQSLVVREGDSIVAVILNDHILITRAIINDLQRELVFIQQSHTRAAGHSSSSSTKNSQSFENSARDSQ